MTDWLCEFILGAWCAYMAMEAWDRLKVWWREGKEDLQVEILDGEDPRLQDVRLGRD